MFDILEAGVGPDIYVGVDTQVLDPKDNRQSWTSLLERLVRYIPLLI